MGSCWLNLGCRRMAGHLVGHGAGPAHPGGRGLGMVAELLRHPCGAAGVVERADGCGDGLPDLADAWVIGTLQRRHEEGVGTGSMDAEVVCCWPHRELLGPGLLRSPAGAGSHTTSLPRTRRRSNGAALRSGGQVSPPSGMELTRLRCAGGRIGELAVACSCGTRSAYGGRTTAHPQDTDRNQRFGGTAGMHR